MYKTHQVISTQKLGPVHLSIIILMCADMGTLSGARLTASNCKQTRKKPVQINILCLQMQGRNLLQAKIITTDMLDMQSK